MNHAILLWVVWIVEGGLILFAAYNLVIAFFGLRSFRPVTEKVDGKPPRFAVLVPAHNEERVVARCVETLLAQHYPRESFDIWVVADRCSDKTADVARTAGALVWERTSAEAGKAPAMRDAIARLLSEGYDAFAVIDADNLVDPEFLAAMARHLGMGEKLIQGYLGTKNPADSWVTVSYAIAYWAANRLFQLAKYRMGLTCGLGGTGLVVASDLLMRHNFDVQCLTDDLEYQMRVLLAEDVPTTWAHEAVIYDEKPIGFWASWRQRMRWMQGHWWVACHYALPLVWKGIRTLKLRYLDAALYCVVPSRFMLIAAMGVFATLHTLSPFLPRSRAIFGGSAWPASVWWVLAGLHLAYPFVGLILERIPKRFFPRFIYVPFFFLSWIPIGIVGFFRRNRKAWVHTEHDRDLTLDEVEVPAKGTLAPLGELR